MRYVVELDEKVRDQLGFLTARERSMVLKAIGIQLGREPLTETRNRKRLRQNPVAPWELRVRNLRVFYDVTSPDLVRVIAVGRVSVGAKEIRLWNR